MSVARANVTNMTLFGQFIVTLLFTV
jgi:hypothetical protein